MKDPNTEPHWLRSFAPAAVACEDCAADLIPDGAEIQAAPASDARRWSWASWRNRCPHVRNKPRGAK